MYMYVFIPNDNVCPIPMIWCTRTLPIHGYVQMIGLLFVPSVCLGAGSVSLLMGVKERCKQAMGGIYNSQQYLVWSIYIYITVCVYIYVYIYTYHNCINLIWMLRMGLRY